MLFLEYMIIMKKKKGLQNDLIKNFQDESEYEFPSSFSNVQRAYVHKVKSNNKDDNTPEAKSKFVAKGRCTEDGYIVF